MLRWVLRILAVAITAGVGAALWFSRREQARVEFMGQAKQAVKKAVEKAHEVQATIHTTDPTPQSASPEALPDDPLFDADLWQELASAIKAAPQMLQTELYSQYPPSRRADLRATVRLAADAGLLVRTKAGRTYTLSLPT